MVQALVLMRNKDLISPTRHASLRKLTLQFAIALFYALSMQRQGSSNSVA